MSLLHGEGGKEDCHGLGLYVKDLLGEGLLQRENVKWGYILVM